MKRLITIAFLILPVLLACTEKNDEGSEGATSVVLSQDKVDLHVGETVALTATVLPESLEMGVVWSVIDSQYADVSNGTITAKAEGVTYVIAVSADGKQRAACMVSVNPSIAYNVSIKDESGTALKGLYGYPGMSTILSASTSDGETHRFTWSLEDESIGTISEDGRITLEAVASTDPAFVYYAESYLKVVTEDGYGTRIPIRSSLLKGLDFDGLYHNDGMAITVTEESTYPIALLYQDAASPSVIPADGINLELSNNTDFSIQKESGAYSLVTGSATGVSTTLKASTIGSLEKVTVAEFRIDKSFPIKAQCVGGSSSTLVFNWTEGQGPDYDEGRPFTATLYKDAACTEIELSYSIPADDGCWKSRQPRFVFCGLAAGTDYWFKVTETGSDEIVSDVIKGTTEEFNLVMVSSDPAEEGDIILAEDFGQLCWGADEINLAAGIEVVDGSYGYNSNTGKSFSCRDAAMFVGTTGQFARFSLTAQSTAKKENGFRLAKWAQGQYGRIYVGPGYLFLSTTKYGTHIVTPELTSIPEETSATLKVTVHAAGKVSGKQAVFAVQHGKSFYEISSGKETNKTTLDLSTNIQTITYNGGITNLEEFEVTLEGVVKGDRIAFGPTSEKTEENSNMMIITDMTVQIIELQ